MSRYKIGCGLVTGVVDDGATVATTVGAKVDVEKLGGGTGGIFVVIVTGSIYGLGAIATVSWVGVIQGTSDGVDVDGVDIAGKGADTGKFSFATVTNDVGIKTDFLTVGVNRRTNGERLLIVVIFDFVTVGATVAAATLATILGLNFA